MKYKVRFSFNAFLLIVPLVFILFSCKQIMVKYEESGKTFQVQIDDIVKLQLPGDPTTGNAWRKIVYNDTVLIRVGKSDYKIGDEVSGDGGFYYYRFRAIAPGKSIIKMEYGNRFKSEKKAVKNFEITVVVKENPGTKPIKEDKINKPYE